MKILKVLVICLAWGISFAHAGIQNDLINVAYIRPADGVSIDIGTQRVSDTGAFFQFYGSNFAVRDKEIEFFAAGAAYYDPGKMVGYTITNLDTNFPGSYYLNAAKSSATFAANNFSLVGNRLTIDMAGYRFENGDHFVLSLVPEPAAYAMLTAGMALTGGIALRRRRHRLDEIPIPATIIRNAKA
jgi:hypothetical protein